MTKKEKQEQEEEEDKEEQEREKLSDFEKKFLKSKYVFEEKYTVTENRKVGKQTTRSPCAEPKWRNENVF